MVSQYPRSDRVQGAMKTARFHSIAAVALMLGIVPSRARAAGDDAVSKPVRTLINAIRYQKDAIGLKSLAGETQGRTLLGADWGRITPAQREEFVRLFHGLLAGIAFPRVRADFEKLETIVYEKAKVNGESAEIGSTIVILHTLKKQEIRAVYRLVAEGKGAWKVVDVTIVGDQSMLTNIRSDQIGPLMKKGGIEHLLKAMRDRIVEVQAQGAKGH